MVLVEADAVEAELVGELHLVEILVIELGALLRIVVAVGIGDPGRAVLLDGVEIGVPVRHQVEVEDFHAATFMVVEEAFERGDERLPLLDLGQVPALRDDR